ncbi:hypothetical protein E2C01_065618 [Portunus trituberculatus]|uniref:Uncharacterized protein n=1 Tax=Portunus trituberculatus TaxID=210409 RepID=A0A5B7HJB3_PORTR|nr:hypothetical protein [Portunus trituberculatus]
MDGYAPSTKIAYHTKNAAVNHVAGKLAQMFVRTGSPNHHHNHHHHFDLRGNMNLMLTVAN